jgi:hypothetical protein
MYCTIWISTETWNVLLVGLLILIAQIGLSVFNYLTRKKKIQHDNVVAGIIFSVVTLIYSLIIAFAILAVWQNFEDLNRTIEKEVSDLNTVLVHSNMLPDSIRQNVAVAIKDYCEKVVNEEWGAQEDHIRFRESAIPKLRLLLFRAQTDKQIPKGIVNVLDENLTNITKLRQERLHHTRAYVPGLVWMSLVVGSIMVVCFSYLLYLESMQLKRIFLTFLWAIMGMSLFLIYMLDHPFSGGGHVSKQPYEMIIQSLSGS